MPKSEKPFCSARAVKEPSIFTEFEIQATLYCELRELGFNVRGEVKTGYSENGTKRKRAATCRFDLAEFKDGALIGIIEVKPNKTKHKTPEGWLGTRQGARYKNYGVPVTIVYGMDHAWELISRACQQKRIF